MLSKSPLNYLITFCIGVVLWVILGFFIGNYLSEEIDLNYMDIETWIGYFRIITGIATFLVLLILFFWYYWGDQDDSRKDLKKSRSKYIVLFIICIVICFAALVGEFIIYFNEGINSIDYIWFLLVLIFLTIFYFWISSFLLSPSNVFYIPFFRRKQAN